MNQTKVYVGNRPYNRFAHLCKQKALLETHYNFLVCRIENEKLICTATLNPPGSSQSYKIRLEYTCGKEPRVFILEPHITGSIDIHMYDSHRLCLYYPEDLKWSEKTLIYRYTIPWTIEWIIFYELYLVNGGIWEGRESPAHISLDEDLFF